MFEMTVKLRSSIQTKKGTKNTEVTAKISGSFWHTRLIPQEIT
jgi:hypothetical protein